MRFATGTALAALSLFAVTAGAQAADTVITPGQGRLTDTAGDTWIITADGAILETLPNGSTVWTPGGGGTAALTIVNGTVYGEDAHGRGWFDLSSGGQYWTSTAEPAGVNMPVIAATTAAPAAAGTAIPAATATTAAATATTNPCAGVASGGFNVSGGQLLGPNGQPFIARGIDLWANDMSTVSASLISMFPGINMVRIYDDAYQDPSTYASFIQTMTSRGIVVAIVDAYNGAGNGGGGQGVAFTGQPLLTQQAWYQTFATTYANNPYVWFGPNNEPPQAGLTAWEQESYNTIRSAGNNSIIMLDLPGGGYPGNTIAAYGMDPSVYAQMTNVVLDPHFYGWAASYSTDQATVSAKVQSLLTAAQLQTADGIAPEIIGEFGNSTNGNSIDANWQQVVQAAETSGVGSTAWAWNGGGTGDILVQGSLTQYGAMVAGYIAKGGGVIGAAVASATTACPSLASNPAALAAANTAAVVGALTGTAQTGATPLALNLDSSVMPATPTQATAAPATPATTATTAATESLQTQAADNVQQADQIAASVNSQQVQQQAQSAVAAAQAAIAAAQAGNSSGLGVPQ